MMDNSGNINHDIVNKIRDMKKDFKDKLDEALREKAISEVKVEAMATKIKDIE
jgi:hypothetical protein